MPSTTGNSSLTPEQQALVDELKSRLKGESPTQLPPEQSTVTISSKGDPAITEVVPPGECINCNPSPHKGIDDPAAQIEEIKKSLRPKPRPEKRTAPAEPAPRLNRTVGVETLRAGGKKEPLSRLGSCTGRLKIFASWKRGGTQCAKGELISENLAKHLEQHTERCTRQAMSAAGDAPLADSIRGVTIISNSLLRRGAYVAGSGRRSLHSAGRAIDILNINVETATGNKSYRMGRGRQTSFERSFRSCWKKSYKCGGSDAGGQMDYRDGSTFDHVHVSIRYCGRSEFTTI